MVRKVLNLDSYKKGVRKSSSYKSVLSRLTKVGAGIVVQRWATG
jgi:hypothetical protein